MLNVEKVERPPNMPVVRKSFARSVIHVVSFSIPARKPIKKPAIIFETNVANGNRNGKGSASFVIR